MEQTVKDLRAGGYRNAGLSIEGARIHAEVEMRAAKADHFSSAPRAALAEQAAPVKEE